MEGKKTTTMQIKAETGGRRQGCAGSTTDLLSFLEGSGWESRFPLSKALAFFTEQEILSCFAPAIPAEPGLMV